MGTIVAVKRHSRLLDQFKYNQIVLRIWLVAQVCVLPIFVNLSDIFSCRETSYLGKYESRMIQFPDVVCSDALYISTVVIVGLLIVLPTAVGMAYTQYLVYRERDILDSQKGVVVLSAGYSDKYWYWWFVEVVERASFGVLGSAFRYPETNFSWV